MKKSLTVVSILTLAVGALLCAFILKDMQISVTEAAAGLIWLLAMNALAMATVRAGKKSAGEKSAAPSVTLLRRPAASAPELRKPAA